MQSEQKAETGLSEYVCKIIWKAWMFANKPGTERMKPILMYNKLHSAIAHLEDKTFG